MGRAYIQNGNVVGHLIRWSRGGSAPPRWTLFQTDGTLHTFGDHTTREEVKDALAQMGLRLRDDDKVVPAEGEQCAMSKPAGHSPRSPTGQGPLDAT